MSLIKNSIIFIKMSQNKDNQPQRTGAWNTDDTDWTDFHGYEIRAHPCHPCNPCSIRTFSLLSMTALIAESVVYISKNDQK